jgi:DnaJ-class molecular chaperone
MYGNITVTRRETAFGARKLVNIPKGFKKKLFVLIIPPGTSEGSKMKLSGLGRKLDGGESGDLYLKVNMED